MFCIGGIIGDVKWYELDYIDHGGAIIIGGLPLDWGEELLCSFKCVFEVFGCHGVKRGSGIPTIEKT